MTFYKNKQNMKQKANIANLPEYSSKEIKRWFIKFEIPNEILKKTTIREFVIQHPC